MSGPILIYSAGKFEPMGQRLKLGAADSVQYTSSEFGTRYDLMSPVVKELYLNGFDPMRPDPNQVVGVATSGQLTGRPMTTNTTGLAVPLPTLNPTAAMENEIRNLETVIAALVYMMGGSVIISEDEMIAADRMGLKSWKTQDPTSFSIEVEESP